MRDAALLQQALGLAPPWAVSRSDFDPEAHRLDIEIDFAPGSRFACPTCGAVDCPGRSRSRCRAGVPRGQSRCGSPPTVGPAPTPVAAKRCHAWLVSRTRTACPSLAPCSPPSMTLRAAEAVACGHH